MYGHLNTECNHIWKVLYMDYLSKIRVKGILTDQGIPEASQEHLTQGFILKLLSKMSEFPRIFARKTCELHSEKSQNLTWDHLTQGLGGNMDDIERAIAAMQRGTPTRAAVQHRIQDAVQVPNPNRMQFRVGVTVIDTCIIIDTCPHMVLSMIRSRMD